MAQRKNPDKRTGHEWRGRRVTSAGNRLAAVTPQDVPEPLRPLGGPGLDMWDRVHHTGPWLDHPADRELVQRYCELVDEREDLRQRVMTAGDWRDRAGLRRLDDAMLRLGRELGLGPVNRFTSGIPVPDPAGETPQLARMRRAAGMFYGDTG